MAVLGGLSGNVYDVLFHALTGSIYWRIYKLGDCDFEEVW
jgi:hypothetical protein